MIFIKCMICEKEFRRITKTHLITHNIQNTAEYLKMFPGVEYIASDILEKESTRLKLNNPMHDARNCKKVSDALTGKKLSEEHKKQISNRRKGVPTRSGPHSDDTKNKISNTLKGRYIGELNPMYGVSLVPSHETIEKRKTTRKERESTGRIYSSNKGKKLDLTDEQRLNRSIKRCTYLKNHGTNKKDTDIELKFKNFLEELNIKFEQQYILIDCGAWLFDFYLPNTNQLVELDGEFWHRKKQQFNRDIIKEDIASRNNYEFVRISSFNLDFNIIFADNNAITKHNNLIMDARGQLWK